MRHLRSRSGRLSPRGRVIASVLLAGTMLACWHWGGGRVAGERWLQTLGGHLGARAATPLLLLTRLGNLPLLGPIALLLTAVLATRRGVAVALAYLGALALFRPLVSAIKWAVDRPRPALTPHLDRFASGWSFPSAHSADSMAVFLGFALLWGGRNAMVAALLLSGAIGISRVALGVHWPSDVLAGWSLGALWAIGIHALLRRSARGGGRRRA